MELCDALDLEEFMRKMPESGHQAFRVEEMLPLMFQMVRLESASDSPSST